MKPGQGEVRGVLLCITWSFPSATLWTTSCRVRLYGLGAPIGYVWQLSCANKGTTDGLTSVTGSFLAVPHLS